MRMAWLALALLTPLAVERNGHLEVEAERFTKQERTEKRSWRVGEAEDPRTEGASGGWITVLPDTRKTHADRLIRGENFSNTPGEMAVLSYPVEFTTPGRYHVWVRAYSTGTEDNGVHVGIDGEWPESGARMQWCEGKRTWRWESRQRTEANHCGEPGKIFLDVKEPGVHTVQFSMREDGFAMDRFLLTRDPAYSPR